MSANRYTQEQILCGLRIFWQEEVGCDYCFEAGTGIDEYFSQKSILDEIDVTDIIDALEYFFNFSCPPEEWQEHFGFAETDPEEWKRRFEPRWTFGGLANFIRERVQPISFEPLTILGKPCRTAGIFRGLEQLAQQLKPKANRFAPSTPIRACLRGFSLHRYWNHLRWINADQLPPPPRIAFGFRGFLHSMWFKFAIGLLIGLWNRDLPGMLTGMFVTFLLFIPLGMIVTVLNTFINPLPKEIRTFGDLARYLAVFTENKQPQGA